MVKHGRRGLTQASANQSSRSVLLSVYGYIRESNFDRWQIPTGVDTQVYVTGLYTTFIVRSTMGALWSVFGQFVFITSV